LANRKRVVKQSFPDVLAVAGPFVRAFRKPNTIGDHSFPDIRMDCSKGRKPDALEGCGQGPSVLRMASILSKTAGARGDTSGFFNGLICQPAQTGEDRNFA
jgi:hypothetical protein